MSTIELKKRLIDKIQKTKMKDSSKRPPDKDLGLKSTRVLCSITTGLSPWLINFYFNLALKNSIVFLNESSVAALS